MPEQQCHLVITKAEHICRQPLFVRSLVEDAEVSRSQRFYSLRMPPDCHKPDTDQLMPVPASRMTIDGGTERRESRGLAHQRRCSLPTPSYSAAAGARDSCRRRPRCPSSTTSSSCQCNVEAASGNLPVTRRNSVARFDRTPGRPSHAAHKYAVLRRRAQRAPLARSHPQRWSDTRRPYATAASARDLAVLHSTRGPRARRRQRGCESPNARAIGTERQGIARHFAQIRHHGPLVRPLLERAVELRQRDRPAPCSSFASDFIAREISEISVARFSPAVVACISCR